MLPHAMLARVVSAALDGVEDAFATAQTAAHEAAPSPFSGAPDPTEAQAKAGNYRTGELSWQGLALCIENPAGTIRQGRDADGNGWRTLMPAHYGYFKGTRGADGDGVDLFLGPEPENESAYVINQTKADGSWDEHKVMVGFPDRDAAVAAYRVSYGDAADKHFAEPVVTTVAELKDWLTTGNTRTPFGVAKSSQEISSMQALDTKAAMATLDRVFWTAEALPAAGQTLDDVLYAIRGHDAADGLVFDPMTMADVTEGTETVLLDALVTEAGRLKPRMLAMERIMQAVGGPVKPLAFQISNPVQRFGGVHVAVIFELSDGQTLTVWFHNPDSSPKRISPADELVSWKWQLNKKDVTIVVAPEHGTDLNMRDAARRIMRVAAKNSAAFAKANANRAASLQEIDGLRTELVAKQQVLKGLHDEIDVARAEADAKAAKLAAGPEWKQQDFDPTTPETYALVVRSGEEALLWNQDALDATFQTRLIETRNALRDKGWTGERMGDLSKDGQMLVMDFDQSPGSKNILGLTLGVGSRRLVDDLTKTPVEMAGILDGWADEAGAAAAAAAAESLVAIDQATDEALKDANSLLGGLHQYEYATFTAGATECDIVKAKPANEQAAAKCYGKEQVENELQRRRDVAGAAAAEAAAQAAVAQAQAQAEANAQAAAAQAQAEAQAAAEREAAAAMAATEDPSSPDLAYLRDVNRGAHDGDALGDLLEKITAAINALNAAGGLAGAADTAANDAITHWVELDAKANG